jgi:hypothetical protein
MAEEIKIVVKQEGQGSAIKDAEKDLDKLQKKGKSALATPAPDLNAPQTPSAPEAKKAQAQERRESVRRNRQLVADAEEDLVKARARGAGASEIKDLQSQVREQKLAGRFQREQGLSDEDAIAKARNLVSLQNEGAEVKEKAAQSSRQQAGEEAASAKQALAAKKEAATKEKLEQREQLAVLKAKESYATRVARAGGSFAEGIAGGSQFGGIASALGSGGGPIGMIVAAVAAATVGVAAAFAKQSDQRVLMGIENRTDSAVLSRHLRRQAGFEGTAASNRQEAQALQDDAFKRNLDRELLQKKSEFKWYNPAGWLDQLTGKSENDKNQNEAAIQRDLAGAEKAKAAAREKYRTMVAPEIEAQKLLMHGHAREARALQDKVTWQQEYNRLRDSQATDEEAKEGADTKIATIQRDRAGSFAKTLGARAGAGEVARVARLAAHQADGRNPDLGGDIRALHDTVRRQGDEAFRTKFSRRTS